MNIKIKYVEMQKELLKEVIPAFEGKYEYENGSEDNYAQTTVRFKDFKITKSGNLYVLFSFERIINGSNYVYIRSESADDILSERITPDNLIPKGNKIENLQELKESLGINKFNKITSLINECLKEGMEVEITIPKNKCKNLNESLTEEEKDELEIFLKNAEGNFPNKAIPMTYMRTQSKNNSSKVSILINQLGDNDLKVACKELGYRIV